MLFAAYTPQPGYTPPRKGANPWIIIGGVCGGCLLVVIVSALVGSYFVYKKVGPFMQRNIASAMFFENIKKHDYKQAETRLTPEAQAKYSPDWLAKHETQAESTLGALENSSSVYGNNSVKSVDDLNKIADVPFTVNYEKGSRRVILHFDASSGDTKIADIDWNADDSSGASQDSKSGADSKDSGTQQ